MKKRRRFWTVVEKLEALIDKGVYPAGSRLPAERELAEAYDVSRPTIREAIIALEVRERVEVKTGSGVYITDVAGADLSVKAISAFELTQARALVEAEAAALAAATIRESELSALKQALDDMSSADKANKANEADEADQRFHEIISRATRNNAIVMSINNLWKIRRNEPQVIAAYKDVCSQGIEQRIKEHTAIYDAIAKRDSSAARKAMHNHFNRLINALFEASEAKALEEIKRKTDETRGLYSIAHLNK